ncbi:MAG: biotin transporter BioY [Bacteroidota bacterium]
METSNKLVSIRSINFATENTIGQAFWIAVFALLTAAGARIEIPHEPVPYTLQTLFVLLAGAFLGMRSGTLSQIAYLVAGVVGLPVFAGGEIGLARLLGPTGGYLLAFPAAAFLVGWLVRIRRGFAWTVVSMAIGLLMVFVSGTIQLNLVYLHDWSAAVQSGFLIFSWWDLLKLGAAAMIYDQFARRWTSVPSKVG